MTENEVIEEFKKIKSGKYSPEILRARVVDELRKMKSLGQTPSAMLKHLKNECAIISWIDIFRYFRLAFDLSLKEVSPIQGWLSGEISDERIDKYISDEW
ncbi:MAG: hypothetical protein HY254_07905 [Burkholderiales bacterium]|nr:hypothetical protein [Burkholderiales bacterium]